MVDIKNYCLSVNELDDPVVHVKVWWITKTRKDPACTLLTEG